VPSLRLDSLHRCTRVENPGGGGTWKFLLKSLGGEGFQEKLPPILGFIAFILTSFSKICLGGAVSYPSTPYPPLCASKIFLDIKLPPL
jgi:hypothetical protein